MGPAVATRTWIASARAAPKPTRITPEQNRIGSELNRSRTESELPRTEAELNHNGPTRSRNELDPNRTEAKPDQARTKPEQHQTGPVLQWSTASSRRKPAWEAHLTCTGSAESGVLQSGLAVVCLPPPSSRKQTNGIGAQRTDRPTD